MKEQFCNYEISLKLKELGFNEDCLGGFLIADEGQFAIYGLQTNHEYLSEVNEDWLNTPLYSQAFDYFREKYELLLSIYRLNDNWVWQIFDIERNCYITEMTVRFSELKRSYEECRDQIILKAIELCQNKK